MEIFRKSNKRPEWEFSVRHFNLFKQPRSVQLTFYSDERRFYLYFLFKRMELSSWAEKFLKSNKRPVSKKVFLNGKFLKND